MAGIPSHNRVGWLPAQVPGHVHLDLVRAGVIADPFIRMNERGVQWVDDTDWVYETSFSTEEPPAGGLRFLKFHGLDTVARIELNGELLGESENMLVPHEFEVTSLLRNGDEGEGLNTLRVKFQSAKQLGFARQREWNAGSDPVPYHWDTWAPRSMVRKAQYMYGWDWGPVLISCGIWQPVELIVVPTARLLDWKYTCIVEGNKATVGIEVEVERAPGIAQAPLSLRLSLADEPSSVALATVPDGCGRHTVAGRLIIENPELWQPNGLLALGEQPRLYPLEMAVVAGEQLVDSRSERIGLRTVELLHETDADGDGEGFQFRINGQGIFAKGANWIPNDSFPSLSLTENKSALRERVTQARDAGFNMLRVWGGGLYESEEFYDLCDELGILVWQDFGYGCAYYPDTGEYAKRSRQEAIAAVRRIRNHASLALWCGNNENDVMFRMNWHDAAPQRFVGEHLYHEILPAVVAAEDPATPYWPSSPYGGEHPGSEDTGDCHNWDVWHGRGDWVHYVESQARFCSEFGFAASCGMAAWNSVLSSKDREPRSAAVRWHDKTRKGYDTYLDYVSLHFPSPQTLEELVYYSQCNQAEALRCGVEHYRRLMGRCWGTLYWQFNDCWPVQSWSVIDSLGEPKAAYYASKRFYAPVLVSLLREGNTIAAHIVSDLRESIQGQLTLSVELFDGTMLECKRLPVTAAANEAAKVAEIDIRSVAGCERRAFVYATFVPEGSAHAIVAAENLLLLAEPKHLELSGTPPEIHVQAYDDERLSVEVSAREFAAYVWLRRSDQKILHVGDNFFHLRAGATHRVLVANPERLTAEQMAALVVCRTLESDT